MLTSSGPLPRWVVASGLGLTLMLGLGTSSYLLTVLAGPIKAETGWGLEWIIAGLTVATIGRGIASPAIGRWVKRSGGQTALMISSGFFAAGLSTMAMSHHFAVYLAGWVLMGCGMACGLYEPVFGTLGRLYGLEARRLIVATTLWGGFASTVFWPLSGLLTHQVGWRWTCVVYAALHLVIALPIYRWVLPGRQHLLPAPEDKPPPPADAQSARRDRITVFGFGLALIGEVFVTGSMLTHLVALLGARGVSTAAAIALGAFVGPAQVAARLGEMVLGSRHHPGLSLLAATLLIATGVVCIAFLPPAGLPVAFVFFGMGSGLIATSRGTLGLHLFGPIEAPVVLGKLGRPVAFMSAVMPWLTAVAITHLGGKTTLSLMSVAAWPMVIGAVILWVSAGRTKASPER